MHEENIRDGGKTVHVVFKYLSRSLLLKGVGAGAVSPPSHPHHQLISQLIRISFKDDITIILLLSVSFLVI
jgi:hypothetical protein